MTTEQTGTEVVNDEQVDEIDVEQPTSASTDAQEDYVAKLKSDPEALERLFAELDDETTSKVPAFNRRVDRGISKRRAEIDKEVQAKIAEMQKAQLEHQRNIREAQYLIQQVNGIDAEQRWNLIDSNPELWARYQNAKRLVSTPQGRDEETIVNTIWENAKAALTRDLGEVDLEDASTLTDVVKKFTHASIDKERQALKEQMDKEMEAMKAELMGQLNLSADQPDKNASSGKPYVPKTFAEAEQAYGDGLITLEQYKEAMKRR